MKKTRGLSLYTIGLAIAIIVTACEDTNITETPEPPEEEVWSSVVEEWEKNEDLSSEEKALLKKRVETAIRIKEEGMPEEITHAWNQWIEDYKEFLGVEELPKREIAPGVYSWIPEEYLVEGEKREKLREFYVDRIKNIISLYEKYGLREPGRYSKQPNTPPADKKKALQNYAVDSFISVSALGSWEVLYNYYASTTQRTFIISWHWMEKLEVVDDRLIILIKHNFILTT